MIIGINKNYQIKEVNAITDNTLTVIELDETSEYYPFKNCSETEILCYCYKQNDSSVSIYPYVDTNKIADFKKEVLNLQAQVIELEFEKITGGMI